jgi:hypothetical protein
MKMRNYGKLKLMNILLFLILFIQALFNFISNWDISQIEILSKLTKSFHWFNLVSQEPQGIEMGPRASSA